MRPVDYVIIFVIGSILGLALGYIRKARKSGRKCIGCPNSAGCSGNCAGCSAKD